MYLDFIKYFFRAKNAHGIHSPFVFEFYNKVFKPDSIYSEFSDIENIRKDLLKNKSQIKRLDLGAGKKKVSDQMKESVSEVAKTSLKPKKWGSFLYRVIDFYDYKTIIDLGTSFGITTAYLAKGNPKKNVITLEGCTESLKIAKENFKKLNLQKITIIEGNIDDTLTDVLESTNEVDFVFFDANHRKEPTIRYFEACLLKKHEKSCFAFDDIYWSKEMKEAWQQIKNHPEVTFSIDLFFIGLIFFRKDAPKQHFSLK